MLAAGARFLIAGFALDDVLAADVCLEVNQSFGNDVIVTLEAVPGGLVDRVCVCSMECADSTFAECDFVLENPVDTSIDTNDSLFRDAPCWSADPSGESWFNGGATPESATAQCVLGQ